MQASEPSVLGPVLGMITLWVAVYALWRFGPTETVLNNFEAPPVFQMLFRRPWVLLTASVSHERLWPLACNALVRKGHPMKKKNC